MTADVQTFDLAGGLPGGWVLIEASAGTGKTYSLTAMVARYVAELGVRTDELLMVTFTRAAAAELREQTRVQIATALAALRRPADEVRNDTTLAEWVRVISDCDDDERVRRRQRLADAVVAIDAATISTIHGFFSVALAELGLRSGDLGSASVDPSDPGVVTNAMRDVLVATLADDPAALSDSDTPEAVERHLRKVLAERSANAASVSAPVAGDGPPEVADRWVQAVDEIVERSRAARAVTASLSFDDLINDLVGLLDDPDLGHTVRAALRSRYRLVFIDEFQDTDVTQWRLFSETFTPPAGDDDRFLALVAVGDPKQAIYRFRGADISAYLEFASDPRMVRFQMARNWRSDACVVRALNGVLAGAQFGDSDIAYVEVDTPAQAENRRLAGAGAPVQIRWLAKDADDGAGGTKSRNADQARLVVADDAADHIVTLLQSGQIHDADKPPTPIGPGDICILVRSHTDADPVIDALARRGVPAVRSRVGSVLATEVTHELRVLLSALADPADGRRVRAAMLGWFINRPVDDLFDDAAVADMQEQCRRWAVDLASYGVAGFHQRLLADRSVVLAIAATGQAERHLTDIEHVMELLSMASGGGPVPARRVLVDLERLVSDPTMATSELAQRRVDSDAAAVQVTTVHSSKGLEYPVVLVPFVKAPRPQPPFVYSHDGVRYVDAAPTEAWERDGLTVDDRKALAGAEEAGDELRLLYVALTRARHQLVVWWSSVRGGGKSPLGRLLFGDTTDVTAAVADPDDGVVQSTLVALAGRVGPDLSVAKVAEPVPERVWNDAGAGDVNGLSVAQWPQGRAVGDRSWYRWSYSSMTAALADRDEPSPRGGTDEPLADGDDEPGTGGGHLCGLPAGRGFGTFVHEVFERVDFTADPLDEALVAAVTASDASTAGDLGEIAAGVGLVAGLADVVHTPLDVLGDGVTLRDIPMADRLNEMEFTFAVPDPVAVAAVFALAADDGDPVFGPYFARLAADAGGLSVAGLMTGSIDLVARVGGGDGHRYVVADYKTNRLHNPGVAVTPDSYGRQAMVAAMEHGHYPVQALVYSVALHRMLSLRLPGYDIDRHLGPACYLFVRGMVGPATPVVDGVRAGVFAWRPSSRLVQAVSAVLAGGS